MVNEEIVGNDIDRNWTLNAGTDNEIGVEAREGDLSLVRGSDNLSQAIYLRLTAYLNSMRWAYDNYGSTTKDWLGQNNTPYKRATLIDEIRLRVNQDPRIREADIEILNWTDTSIGIKITADVIGGKTFQDYFIFSDLPRKNENINSPEYLNTYIETRQQGYYAKQGQLISVHCYVRDHKEGKKVPIGEVSAYIGTYMIENDGMNPQEVAQSGSNDPGGCTFTFRVPQFITLGTHKLIFRYKGIRGYNDCVGSTDLYVVDRLPTTMEFIYPRPQYKYYYANDYDVWTDPVVEVRDANDFPVLHGEVRYYMSDYAEDGDFIFIEYPIIFHVNKLIPHKCYLYCKSKVLDYSIKFIFRVNYMFRPGDIFELVGQKGEHIDYIECGYNKKEDAFLLYSTEITKQFETVNSENKQRVADRNEDITTQRKSNSHITMEVIE